MKQDVWRMAARAVIGDAEVETQRSISRQRPWRSRRMSHLRLVTPAPDVRVADRTAAGDAAPGAAVAGDRLVPARLMLALAGRCSCTTCCAAYAAGRQEPHDPRLVPEQRRPRAI
jgi:hypothetical protein